MGVIGKIRSYSGLLIAIIGLGLAAFVLGDLFQYGPRSSGRPDMEIAKINNTSLSIYEFEERYNQFLENWKHQTGISSPQPSQVFRIRQQAWDQMIGEVLLEEKLEKIGMDVSSDELFELITGANPHPYILQSFTNPQTGQFDRQQVHGFIQNLDMVDHQTRNQWFMIESYIKKERKETKFQNLLAKSLYVPGILAEIDHINKNSFADITIIAKRYNSIPDDEVEVSQTELRKAYEENKYLYKREHTRDIDYVVINVEPTEKDRLDIKNDIISLKEEFKEVENLERFINSVSDERFDPNYYKNEELTPEIRESIFNSSIGTTYGPYEDNNRFVIAMLNDIQFRPDSMNASHILISYSGSLTDRQLQQQQQQSIMLSYNQAEQKADSLLNVIKGNTGRLPQLAMELSDDPSAFMNQGDLGWFKDGDMVPEFNEAIIAGNTGDVVIAETNYGFHIIHIKGKSPATKKVQIAKIYRDIEPSSDTYRRAFSEVSEFASVVREKKDFAAIAEEKDYTTRRATQIAVMDNTLPGIQNAREIIRWAFHENTKPGSISRIYDMEDRFILAKLSKINKEGIPPLDDIKDEIERIAIREKKYKIISDELTAAIKKTGSLENTAEMLGLEMNSAESLNFNTTMLAGFGSEPKVIGKSVALNQGEISKPIKGSNAVYIIEVTHKSEAIVPDDLTVNRRTLENNLTNRLNQFVESLKKDADIIDKRTSFF